MSSLGWWQMSRWRVEESQYSFLVMCERTKPHIRICYGDGPQNIPLFGTKDQARDDAHCIAEALNQRDHHGHRK